MRLSEAIRLGSMDLPWGGSYTHCAVGAAVHAIGKHWEHDKGAASIPVPFVAWKHWPILNTIQAHPVSEHHFDMNTIISDLNGWSKPNWTRERIADWVESIENSLDVQPVSVSEDAVAVQA